ncbi:Gfo/Idh/MocA family oxidoreductase [Streptosporangium soli]|nr:Gfo/Idh/MocA family oxidoreductase [Streptosporangium sp. KLBMP 9127]
MAAHTTVLVGFGHVARNSYLPELAARGARVRVVDPSPAARAAAEGLGLDALTELPPAEAGDRALILTPIPSHAAMTRAAIERGYHVLVEKPAAPTTRSWADLCGMARRSGRALVAAPFTASGWAAEAIRALVTAGGLGRLTSITVDFAKSGPFDNGEVAPERAWFLGPEAGPARDFGPYPLTLLVGLFGPLEQVRWTREEGADLGHVLRGRFVVDGVAVPLRACFRYADGRGDRPVVITGTRGELVVDSERVDGPLTAPVPLPGPSARRSKYQLALAQFDLLTTDLLTTGLLTTGLPSVAPPSAGDTALDAHQRMVGEVIGVLERVDLAEKGAA